MQRSPTDAALEVMQRHISALNAGDAEGVAATLHFPHLRLAGTTMKTWPTPQHYFDDFLSRAGSQWSHSRFADIKVLQASTSKVHLDARIDRFRADDTLITSFRSLWVIGEIDGVWAAIMRSSFAPQ